MPRGFTMLELLVVLAIAASVMAVALPQFSRMASLFAVKSATRELAAALRSARSEAIAGQRDVALMLDVQARTYRLAGATRLRRLDPQLELKLLAAQNEVSNPQVGAIRFFPDGSSTGGRVTLAATGQSYVVDVNWLTGRVAIHE